MLSLSFDVQVDDIAAFNRFFITGTRAGQLMRAFVAMFAASLPILAVRGGATVVAVGATIGVVVWLLYPQAHARLAAGKAESLSKAPHRGGVLCPHTLTITDDGITETTPVSSQTTAWSLIQGIHVGEAHSFIFLTPQTAHVIPRSRVTDGSYEAFLKEATHQVSTRRT